MSNTAYKKRPLNTSRRQRYTHTAVPVYKDHSIHVKTEVHTAVPVYKDHSTHVKIEVHTAVPVYKDHSKTEDRSTVNVALPVYIVPLNKRETEVHMHIRT